jgi:hypothetical protein
MNAIEITNIHFIYLFCYESKKLLKDTVIYIFYIYFFIYILQKPNCDPTENLQNISKIISD